MLVYSRGYPRNGSGVNGNKMELHAGMSIAMIDDQRLDTNIQYINIMHVSSDMVTVEKKRIT